jgi:[acyl-carrier-protein] S-malonyltransferase
MFEGTAEELKETKVTQPAVFLHSVILAKTLENLNGGGTFSELQCLII